MTFAQGSLIRRFAPYKSCYPHHTRYPTRESEYFFLSKYSALVVGRSLYRPDERVYICIKYNPLSVLFNSIIIFNLSKCLCLKCVAAEHRNNVTFAQGSLIRRFAPYKSCYPHHTRYPTRESEYFFLSKYSALVVGRSLYRPDERVYICIKYNPLSVLFNSIIIFNLSKCLCLKCVAAEHRNNVTFAQGSLIRRFAPYKSCYPHQTKIIRTKKTIQGSYYFLQEIIFE